MTDIYAEDPLTKLNTQLNKSMVLMDNAMDTEPCQEKKNRSIKINTEIQPASTPNISGNVSRRSILKKSDNTSNDRRNSLEARYTKHDDETLNNTEHRLSSELSTTVRPRNLEDLRQKECLDTESSSSTFNLSDISDSEDVWVMDIPRTVDPRELKGKTLVLGEKSKLKIKEERYCAIAHDVKCNITCVFKTRRGKHQYKTVNVKPVGTISVRRKLSSMPKIKPIELENTGVPFPTNLKIRHPLFGASYQGKSE